MLDKHILLSKEQDGRIKSICNVCGETLLWSSEEKAKAWKCLHALVDVFIIPVEEKANAIALQISQALRKGGIKTWVDTRDIPQKHCIKRKLQFANYYGAYYALIIGQSELENKKVKLKDLDERTETEVNPDDLFGIIYPNVREFAV